ALVTSKHSALASQRTPKPTPVPSQLADCPRSSARTCAATLSSLPKLLSAAPPELRQIDRRARFDRVGTARLCRASETFVLIACRERYATALCRKLSALRS